MSEAYKVTTKGIVHDGRPEGDTLHIEGVKNSTRVQLIASVGLASLSRRFDVHEGESLAFNVGCFNNLRVEALDLPGPPEETPLLLYVLFRSDGFRSAARPKLLVHVGDEELVYPPPGATHFFVTSAVEVQADNLYVTGTVPNFPLTPGQVYRVPGDFLLVYGPTRLVWLLETF